MPSFRKKGQRLDPKHQDTTRAKIGNSQILNRLIKLVNGEIEPAAMPPHVVTAALGLLRKTVPDLSQVEQTGDTATFVMRLPEPAADTATWERTTSVSPALANTDSTKH
jgi:hypothetical protein